MTYAAFLFVFVVGPGVGLFVWSWWTGRLSRRWHLAVAATALLAMLYTTPWDNLLVAQGVWSYPADRVAGIVLGYVPIEEYSFFILQTIFVALLVLAVMPRKKRADGG